ncbi:tyrosine-type recombinase/integrase [Ruminococcus callidus]|uniref:tyrosine-type recombinase/integrase n=1 Tax=Ruminococcus callidus TaxID=40519 RepID=UPI003521D2F8
MANITKRNGSYLIRISMGRDANRKQIIRSTTYKPPEGISEKKAEKLANAFAVDFENKCRYYSQYNENMKFSELAEWYFNNYSEVELKSVTAMNYKSQYNNHIKEYLGHKRLKEFTPLMLTDYLKMLHTKDGLSASTCRKVYIVVQSIFKRGLEQGFLRENPCHNVILPKDKNKSKKRYSLTVEETIRFIQLVKNSDKDADVKRIIIFLLFTGTRIGECLALNWEDIDFENRSIHIRHTLAKGPNGLFLDTPKTSSSYRTIGMNDTAFDILKEQKAYCADLKYALGNKYAHPEMVFPSSLGNYRDRSSIYHSLGRITVGTEFADMTLHKLRHCNATILLNSGVELKMISEHLGHSGVEITANIYADVLQSQKIKMANILELKLTEK